MSESKTDYATTEEPAPDQGSADIATLVQQDIESRAKKGREEYGTRLQAGNGRDALADAYQEALDLCMYLRQRLEER
jgi:hypothetical protein